MGHMLTQADVARLVEDPSGENRRDAAVKISATFRSGELTRGERAIAEDILRAMARDVETSVRAALAENLKDYAGLPRDLALAMARDVDAVALPVIRFADVLEDDDLLEIVRTQDTARQAAVAQRATVSERVADALVETGKEDIVATLVGNDGAVISDATFEKVLTGFARSDSVKGGMVHRRQLPVSVAERLVHLVSVKLQEQLVARHALPVDLATDLILQSRERATLGLLSPAAETVDVQALVAQLHANKRLTPSIVLRALCMGDLEFFERGVAVLAGLPYGAARTLIHDQGALGLPAVIDRAGLPESLLPVVRAAIDVAGETQYDGGESDRERFRARMLERVLTYMDDPAANLGADNADYLLERLCGIAVPTVTAGWSARD